MRKKREQVILGLALAILGIFIFSIAFISGLTSTGFSGATTGSFSEVNAGSVSGPVIWFIACAITPFGMPKHIQKG